jgi:hypothetical protein
MLVLGVEAESPLVEVRPPDDHRTGLFESGHAGCRGPGHLGVEGRATGGGAALMIDQVLECDRHSGQWPDIFAAPHADVEFGRALQGSLVVDRNKSVESVLGGVGPVEGGVHALGCGGCGHVATT